MFQTFQVDYVFADSVLSEEARRWLNEHREALLDDAPQAEG